MRPALCLLLLLVGLGLGVALERRLSPGPPEAPPAQAGRDTAVEHALRHLEPLYRCPMHPEVVSERPDSCPICGMALVAVGPAPAEPDLPSEVALSPGLVQRLGVRTAPAEQGLLERTARTVGYVEVEETARTRVTAPLAGQLLGLAVAGPGARVSAGEPLYTVLAPEAGQAQRALAVALGAADGPAAVAAREALRALGVPQASLERIEAEGIVDGRVPVLAEAAGEVLSVEAVAGAALQVGQSVLELADPRRRSVRTEVFSRDGAWVEVGLPVDVGLPELPEEAWQGRVDRILPKVDPVSRAIRLRVAVEDPDGLLRPNMLATLVIRQSLPEPRVHVPREAVIRDGRQSRVLVALGEGRFEPRPVVIEGEYGDRLAIREGLRAGETVVTSAQFLIDSEASLRASLARLGGATSDQAPTPAPPAGEAARSAEPGGPGTAAHSAESDGPGTAAP